MTPKRMLAATALGATLLTGAVGLTSLSVAGAQTGVASASVATSSDGPVLARHRPVRRAALRDAGRVAADTIGIDRSDLRDALRDGQSVAEVAEAHGVDPQAVVDAVVQELAGRLDQAVEKGRISQERADAAEERLPERVSRLVEWHRGDGRDAAGG